MRVLLAVLALALAPVPPAEPVLVNKAKDIRVVSDRDEAVPDFFQRSRVIVGGLRDEDLTKVLEAKAPLEKVFLNYASYNDDRAKESLFGAFVTIVPPTEAVAKLLKEHRPEEKKVIAFAAVARQDAKEPGLYHVVGLTTRSSVGFFGKAEKNEADGFSPADLRHRPAPRR